MFPGLGNRLLVDNSIVVGDAQVTIEVTNCQILNFFVASAGDFLICIFLENKSDYPQTFPNPTALSPSLLLSHFPTFPL